MSDGLTAEQLAAIQAAQERRRAFHRTNIAMGRAIDDVEALLAALDAAEQRERALRAALDISPDDVGRILHESWSRTKRGQGFHGRHDDCPRCIPTLKRLREYPFGAGAAIGRCGKFHPDLIRWEELPQDQKDINLHAFDDVLAEMRRRAALAATTPEVG